MVKWGINREVNEMSPLSKQQLDKIRDERTAQIKKAALRIFARNGYSGTRTSQIAAEAGISEGLIYRYFSSKEELFNVIIQELINESQREFDYLHLVPVSPYEKIKSLTENMLEKDQRYPFMLIERARKDEDIPEKATEILQSYSADAMLDRLTPIFVKGQEMGEFINDDPKKLASWYFFIVNSICLQDWEKEKYGMPSVEALMRILKG